MRLWLRIVLHTEVTLTYNRPRHGSYNQRRRLASKPKLKHAGSKVKKNHSIRAVIPKSHDLQMPKKLYPEEIHTADERKFYDAFRLRLLGGFSQDLLGTAAGKMLMEQHWAEVKKLLKKEKPKTKTAALKVIKKAMQLPQQRFIILYEASMRGPLTPNAFQEYMTLFSQLFPDAYKGVYGSKKPAQITAECKRQMKALTH